MSKVLLQYVGWAIGLPLELLIIAALLRGGYRRFPLVFAYALALFLTTAVEIPAYIGHFSGLQAARTRAFYYWVNEGILQVLIFAVVVSFIYRATAGVSARRVVRVALIGGAVLFAGISFLIHYDARVVIGIWMTPWVRDLNFSSAILDLALWSLLLAARKNDAELFMLSGALGVQFTGEAIGQTLRNQFPSVLLMANVIIMLANLGCLYMWWNVFRAVPVRKASVPAHSPSYEENPLQRRR